MKKTASDKNRKNYEYQKTHYRTFAFRLNKIKDKEILDCLNSKDNRAEYIRQLVRNDLENEIR